MGINGLWDVIKDQDHSVPITQLAEEHFRKYGRPMRIAVDEADWRFNNLTKQQVYMIRETSDQPAYQGIEKSMFYRICRLLTLNLQLLFVFDGPGRPWKRGRRGGNRVNYEERRLLKELLTYFRIPHHEAPGEAEAECARLQQLGVVDAVFSQDSDTLMFGCSILVRDDRVAKEKGNSDRSKENTKKSGTSMKVVHGRDIQDKHKLDRDGLVLFAMLCGGDYDTKGLPGCGSSMALSAVRAGLGTSICQCRTPKDCAEWRDELVNYFQTCRGRKLGVPKGFPNLKVLEKYLRPNISLDEKLLNLPGLRDGWNAPIDEINLLEVTSSRFNIWGKHYMNWLGPVLLTKFLVARDPSLPRKHVHGIKFTKHYTKKDEPQPALPPLKSLTFSPFALTTLQQKDFEGERTGYWTSVAKDKFEPDHTVKAEIPTYLLERVLPPDVLDAPPTQRKAPCKRKRQAEDDENNANSNTVTPTDEPKRKRHVSGSKPTIPAESSITLSRFEPSSGNRPYLPKTTTIQRSINSLPTGNKTEFVSLLSDSEDDNLPSERRSSILDLGDSPPDTEDEDEEFNRMNPDILQSCDTSSVMGVSRSVKKNANHQSNVRDNLGAHSGSLPITSPLRPDMGRPSGAICSSSSSTQPRKSNQPIKSIEKTPSAAEVRAARSRFLKDISTANRAAGPASPSTSQLKSKSSKSRRLPEDTDFIDLT